MLIVLNLVSVFFILLLVVKYDKKMIFFWSAIFFLFYMPILIDLILNSANNKMISNVLLFSLTFNCIYLAIGFLIKGKGKDFNISSADFRKKDVYILYSIFVFSVATPVLLVFLKYGSIFNVGWRESKSIPFYVFFLYLYYFSSISLYITLFLVKKKSISFSIMLLGIIFVITFQSRSLILPLIFPIIFHYFYFQYGFKKLKVVLLGSFFLFLFFMLQQFRYVGLNDFSISLALENIYDMVAKGEGELSIIDVFYYLMQSGESVVGFSEGWSYLRILFFFLPTGLFDIKPADFSYEIWNSYTGIHNIGGSLHPTHYGMAFGNFGWLGVFIGPLFLALFSRLYDYVIEVFHINNLLILSSFISGSVLMARGSIYNGFIVVVVGLLLAIFYSYIRKFKL